MKHQLASGLVMEYDDVGRGVPLVLLHAFPFARAMWRAQVEALQDVCRLIVPDLRGFGGTGAFDGPPSVEQMADDVCALLDALNIREPVALGGLSMGGYVALAFARKYASRLRALILADTRAEGDTPEAKANRDKSIASAKTLTAAEFLEGMLPKLFSAETPARHPAAVEEARRIGAVQSPAGIVAALQALRDRPDSRFSLAAITVPTLVIVGRDDTLTPPSAAQTLAAGIRGAQLVTLDGAGHLSNLEQPDRFNQAVRAFFESPGIITKGARRL